MATVVSTWGSSPRPPGSRFVPGEGGNDTERANVETALRLDRPILGESERGTRLFYQPFNPALRMILVGAVHIAQPLSMMAALAGYEIIVVDPRSRFAAAERFPGVRLVDHWPDEALRALVTCPQNFGPLKT